MATRAERFKAEQERTHPKPKPKAAPKRPSSSVDKKVRLEREVSGTVRGKGVAGSGLRNLTNGKRAAYALEDSAGSTPSRKSTRRAAKGGVKTATALTSRQKLKNVAPAARHARGA